MGRAAKFLFIIITVNDSDDVSPLLPAGCTSLSPRLQAVRLLNVKAAFSVEEGRCWINLLLGSVVTVPHFTYTLHSECSMLSNFLCYTVPQNLLQSPVLVFSGRFVWKYSAVAIYDCINRLTARYWFDCIQSL